jgi:PDZ domain-containing protein
VKRLAVGAAVLAAAVVALFNVPSGHYLFVPHPAQPVDPLVSVPGEEDADGDEDDGGIYMVDILVRRAVLLERIWPGMEEGATLEPAHSVNPVGVSEAERRRRSLQDMSRSQQIAVAVALRSLGRRVEVERNGAEVVTVVPGRPAEGKLEVGDVIAAAGGKPVKTPESLVEAMETVRPGEEVELTVVRDGERRSVRVGTTTADGDANRAVFGVEIQQAAEFEFPVDVEIDAGDVGGPSAGLAFALQVLDELGPDVTRGRRVAVTGTLDLDGDVGPVGGVKQKTIGAREADADLFLVPDANVDETRADADDLEVIAISTFDEAVAELEKR